MRTTLLSFGLAMAAACGSTSSDAPATHGTTAADALFAGSFRGRPRLESLPDMDVEFETLTERMRFAWMLAEETLDIPAPALPETRTTGAIQQWTDETLRAWLEQKRERLLVTRGELDAAAEENHRQRIIAGALVGILNEDVARVLLRVPVPAELESDPEIADAFQYVVRGIAQPYLADSRRGYRACALNAVEPRSMQHWSRFCTERMERLPADPGTDSTDEPGTHVTVTRE